jgi:hypothetical protein
VTGARAWVPTLWPLATAAAMLCCGSRSALEGPLVGETRVKDAGVLDSSTAGEVDSGVTDALRLEEPTSDRPASACATLSQPTSYQPGLWLSPSSPGTLAVDATQIYWVDQSGVWSLAKEGGGGQTLAPYSSVVNDPSGFALDDAFVYWDDDQGVNRVPKQGGAVQTIVPGARATARAVDANRVYWTDYTKDSIWSAPKQGGAPSPLTGVLNAPDHVTVDQEHLFFTDDPTIESVPLGGGGVSVLTAWPGNPSSYEMAQDDNCPLSARNATTPAA